MNITTKQRINKLIREASSTHEYSLNGSTIREGKIGTKKWSNADELLSIARRVLGGHEVKDVAIVEYLRFPAFKIHLNPNFNSDIYFDEIVAFEKLADCEAISIAPKAFTMTFKYTPTN